MAPHWAGQLADLMALDGNVYFTSSVGTPMCLPTHGIAAATNTAAATLSGNLSMASARLRPPWLCPTRTSRSPAGAAATASSSGREYSSKVPTSSTRAGCAPDAAMSSAVARCPAARSAATTLYQHHAPWQRPWTRMKCFLLLLLLISIFSCFDSLFLVLCPYGLAEFIDSVGRGEAQFLNLQEAR
uniref:Uncharacterized protein n=1 Tax=Oryza punctata TaxID=4537 RepID=A0A0E0JTD8_ORYPU